MRLNLVASLPESEYTFPQVCVHPPRSYRHPANHVGRGARADNIPCRFMRSYLTKAVKTTLSRGIPRHRADSRFRGVSLTDWLDTASVREPLIIRPLPSVDF